MFISGYRDEGRMMRSLLWIRSGGIVLLSIGLLFIILSGEIIDTQGIGFVGRASDVVLRAGFAIMLIGLFALFLYSEGAFPLGLGLSFTRTQNENMERLLSSMNLKGKGIYMPPGGRLGSDRVFVPVDDRPFPLPAPSDQVMINTGDLGPALGMFLVPPGKAAVDDVEAMTGSAFSREDPEDAQEALERLTRGTGAIGSIAVRMEEGAITLKIRHKLMEGPCSESFARSPRLHEGIGCCACSMVLTAMARIEGAPLSILSVSREGKMVTYRLRRL
jgi:hypothetical protein